MQFCGHPYHSPRAQANSTSVQRQRLVSSFRRWFQDLHEAIRCLNPFVIPREVTMCLSIIFLSAFSRAANGLFTQYTSKLLDWSIATAGYILSVKSLVTLLTLVGLACATQVLERRLGTRPLYLDTWVIRSSLMVLTAGSILVATSKEPVLLISGIALPCPLKTNTVISSANHILCRFITGLNRQWHCASSARTARRFCG